jgi:hypothetical protein
MAQSSLVVNNNVTTANNVLVYGNGHLLGLVQSLTGSRSVNPAPQYQVGTAVYADAPITRAIVNATITGLVPRSVAGKPTATPFWSALGLDPAGGLNQLETPSTFTLAVVSLDTQKTLWSLYRCQFSNDSLQVNDTAPVSYNLTLIAQNSKIWS